MRRREFITLLGGSLLVWSGATVAQQPQKNRRIGVISATNAGNLDVEANIEAFHRQLRKMGWIDGHNVKIEKRWGGGDPEGTRKAAKELAALEPDVILVSGTAALGPMLNATRTVPIVFTNVADPVGAGFVESLGRPGGNVTGFMQFEYSVSGKWVELLKQIAPG
jgi:putative ABC transport system substrate-binding protein